MWCNAHRSKLFLDTKSFFALCNKIEKRLHSEQLNCFDVRNIQAVMNKSDDVTYGNLWRNVEPSNRPFLLRQWRLKNNLMWKLGLVSNISRTENDLHNIFAFLDFCFSAIWSKNQPMLEKQWFFCFFRFRPKFNETGLQYSKSIKKVDIQVQNAFLLQPI